MLVSGSVHLWGLVWPSLFGRSRSGRDSKSTLSLGKINTNFPKSTLVVQRTRSVSVHRKTSVKGRKDVKNKQTTHFHEEKMRNKTRSMFKKKQRKVSPLFSDVENPSKRDTFFAKILGGDRFFGSNSSHALLQSQKTLPPAISKKATVCFNKPCCSSINPQLISQKFLAYLPETETPP